MYMYLNCAELWRMAASRPSGPLGRCSLDHQRLFGHDVQICCSTLDTLTLLLLGHHQHCQCSSHLVVLSRFGLSSIHFYTMGRRSAKSTCFLGPKTRIIRQNDYHPISLSLLHILRLLLTNDLSPSNASSSSYKSLRQSTILKSCLSGANRST